MNDVQFFLTKPDLSEPDRSELSMFLRNKGYELHSIDGEIIKVACNVEDAKNGALTPYVSPDLALSMEDVLSKSISLFDAATRLKAALGRMNPSRSIVIIDRFIFPKKFDTDYFDFFFNIFSATFAIVSNITVFVEPGYNREIAKKILGKVSSEYGKKITIVETEIFHDRFWIIDGVRGIFIGTSLNGVGRKYSIFSELTDEDAREILEAASSLC